MTELEITNYDAEAVAAVEKHITEAINRYPSIHPGRREGSRSETHVLAELIADCVVQESPIPPSWIAQYRYASALRDHLYSLSDDELDRIDNPQAAARTDSTEA